MIAHGATQFTRAMYNAVGADSIPTVEYFCSLGADDVNGVLRASARSGSMNTLKWALSHGATSLNLALVDAVVNVKMPIIKYLLAHGVTDVSDVLSIPIVSNEPRPLNRPCVCVQ